MGCKVFLYSPVSVTAAQDNDLANFLKGRSTFEHTFISSLQPDGNPWISYFTGGNRIEALVNNANGRFRLESQVSLGTSNRNSARITQVCVCVCVCFLLSFVMSKEESSNSFQ